MVFTPFVGDSRGRGGREREGRERERATGPEVEFSAACLAVINVCFAPVQGVDFF